MPVFEAELSDGRIVELEAEKQPSEQDIMRALGQQEEKPKVNALEAAGLNFGLGIAPALGAAAGGRAGLYGGGGIGSLALGFAGAMAGGTLINELQEAVLPESVKKLQQASMEQHPRASKAGGFASGLAGFRFEPLKGVASIPKFLKGTATPIEAQAARGVAAGAGLGAATGVAGPLIEKAIHPDQPLNITPEGIITGGLQPFVFGRSRFERGAPTARPAATPEVQAARLQKFMGHAQKSGHPWEVVPEIEGRPRDVAQTDPTAGKVTLSEKNFHGRMEEDLNRGVSEDEAMANIIGEEFVHGKVFGDPEGRDMVMSYWNNLSGVEKWAVKRIYGDKTRSEWQYANEAFRMAVQRTAGMRPGEHIFGTPGEIRESKALTALIDVVRWVREKFGAKATSEQRAWMDNKVNQLKELQDAISKRGTEETAQREVRPRVGEETRVRQPGQTAEAQAARLEELRKEKVLLGPNEPMEGEVLTDAAVVGPGNKVAIGPHHPGILEKLGIQGFDTQESRNTPDFGFRTNRRPFVPRELAGKIAEKSHQDFRTWDKPIHSDEVASPKGEGTISEQAPPAAPTEGAPEPQAGPAKAAPPGAKTPGAPAATPTVSTTTTPVKPSSSVTHPADAILPSGLLDVDALLGLKNEAEAQYFADKAAGKTPRLQTDTPVSMTRKVSRMAEETASELRNEFGDPIGTYYHASPEDWVKWNDVQYQMRKINEKGDFSNYPVVGREIEAIKNKYGGMPPDPPVEEPASMTRKSAAAQQLSEEEYNLGSRIYIGLKNKVSDQELKGLVDKYYQELISLPADQRESKLAEFEATWASQSLDAARREVQPEEMLLQQIAKSRAELYGVNYDEELARLTKAHESGQALEQDLALLGTVLKDSNRQATVSFINSLNSPIEALPKTETKTIKGTRKSPEYEYESTNLRFKYGGLWDKALAALHKDYPDMPVNFARGWYGDAVRNYLNNASVDRIRELLRMFGKEESFFGKVKEAPRRMPEVDPQPILDEMQDVRKGGGEETDSPRFQKFLLAKGWASEPVKGLEELVRLKQISDKLASERESLGKVAVDVKGTPEAGRTGFTKKEVAELRKAFDAAQKVDHTRRMNALSFLSEKMIGESDPLARHAERPTISFDQIHWDTDSPLGAYGDYTNRRQGESPEFLKDTLGRGGDVYGKSVTTTRGVAVVIDKSNGDVHAVSVYRVGKDDPLIYNPQKPPGSKGEGYVSVDPMLMLHRVKAYFLVKDPVHEFHQRWSPDDLKSQDRQTETRLESLKKRGLTPEIVLTSGDDVQRARLNPNLIIEDVKGVVKVVGVKAESERTYPKSGDEMYDREIGFKATGRDNATQAQIAAHQARMEARAEASALGKEGETLTGEQEQARAAKEAADLEKQSVAGRESGVVAGPEFESKAEVEGATPQEVSVDPNILSQSSVSPEDKAGYEAWIRGPGRNELGYEVTSPASLARGPVTSVESDAIYELLNEFGVNKAGTAEAAFAAKTGPFAKMIATLQSGRAKAKDKKIVEAGYLRGRDYAFVTGMDKIVRKLVREELRSRDPLTGKRIYRFHNAKDIPHFESKSQRDAELNKLTREQQQDYATLDKARTNGLEKALNEIYELAHEAQANHARLEIDTASRPADTKDFSSRVLNKYGDTARRDLEQAAASEKRAAEQRAKGPGVSRELSYEQRQPAGRAPVIPVRGGVTAGRNLPRYAEPPGTLPSGTISPEGPYRPEQAFPLPGVPTTPSEIGGPKFTGEPPTRIPERATPVGLGQEKGFVPQQPGYEKQAYQNWLANKVRVTDPQKLSMTRKSRGRYGISERMMGEMGFNPPPNAKYDLRKEIKAGQDLIDQKKANPYREMIRVKDSGYVGDATVPVIRAWMDRLAHTADILEQQGSPDAKKARKQFEEFATDLKEALASRASKHLAEFRGFDIFGDNGQVSINFFRAAAKSAKGRQRGGKKDADLDPEQESEMMALIGKANSSNVASRKAQATVAAEFKKANDPNLGPRETTIAATIDQQIDQNIKNSLDELPPGTTAVSMAMKPKGGELPPLSPVETHTIARLGRDIMMKLSRSNEFTESKWESEMKKTIFDAKKTHKYDPYLPRIRAEAERLRMEYLNNMIGTGSPTGDVAKIFTRERPTFGESKASLQKALELDPQGRQVTPAEAFHLWNYLRYRFFEPEEIPGVRGSKDWERTTKIEDIRRTAAEELGIKDNGRDVPYGAIRLFKAMTARRSMRKPTEEMLAKMGDETKAKSQASNWLKNLEYPAALRVARLVPRMFFFDKILGHGLVPQITHSAMLAFNPKTWSDYFGRPQWVAQMTGKPAKVGAWREMYRMSFGTEPFRRIGSKMGIGEWHGLTGKDYHELRMQELKDHPHFEWWKSRGAQIDPLTYTDDYQIEALRKIFGDKLMWLTAGRGFDSLKTLRFSLIEEWLNRTPEHLRNEDMGDLIANSVNHATGIVKSRVPEVANWVMFAPRLEMSRWAYLFADTAKAAHYANPLSKATPEQRAWARSELIQKAGIFASYAGALLVNQAFLEMTGDKQKINFWEPNKADWLSFKIAGFRVGVISPFIGMIRMLGRALHAARGDRSQYEKMIPREESLYYTGGKYLRGKLSPLGSFTADVVTQSDYFERPLPWSQDTLSAAKRMRGVTQYGTGEYFSEKFTPIPIEDAIRSKLEMDGMSKSDAEKWIRTLIIAGSMSASGARVVEDKED